MVGSDTQIMVKYLFPNMKSRKEEEWQLLK